MSESNQKKSIAETIVIKLLGYTLVIAGLVSLIGLAWHIWELYQDPELAVRFALALQNAAGEEQVPLALLKLGGWQIMLLLLLVAGKVSVWLIESGKRILE